MTNTTLNPNELCGQPDGHTDGLIRLKICEHPTCLHLLAKCGTEVFKTVS